MLVVLPDRSYLNMIFVFFVLSSQCYMHDFCEISLQCPLHSAISQMLKLIQVHLGISITNLSINYQRESSNISLSRFENRFKISIANQISVLTFRCVENRNWIINAL